MSVWGEYIQEDLLRLLENFASRGIPPRAPTIGQFWYDANSDKLYLWDGVSWKTVFTAINTPIWITPKKLTSTSNVNIQLEAKYATEYKTLNLPSALNGSGNGVVSGTLIPGVYTFNSNAIAQGVSVPKQFELTIKNAPKLPVWITPAKITIATMPLSIQFEASNTIKYILTGGSFPIGTTFTESGLLSGDCVNDLYNFTITAIGEEGSVEKTFELLVNAPVTTTTTTTTARPTTTTTTTTLPVCVDVFESHSEGRYVKTVVKYANGIIEQNGMLLNESFHSLNTVLNAQFMNIVGRPMEYAATVYYYGIYQSECARRGVAYTPTGDINQSIINEAMVPLIKANYNNKEAGFGRITYVGKYCAAKSAGII